MVMFWSAWNASEFHFQKARLEPTTFLKEPLTDAIDSEENLMNPLGYLRILKGNL